MSKTTDTPDNGPITQGLVDKAMLLRGHFDYRDLWESHKSLEQERDRAVEIIRLFLVPQTVGSHNRRVAEEQARAFLAKTKE